MNLRRFFWPALSLGLLILIYFNLGTVNFSQINLSSFLISCLCFFASTVFWAFSWAEIFKIRYRDALWKNSKSLMGIFSPMNIGGDAIRAHFSDDKTRAVASSFVVKFFKFILMGFLLIIGLSLISYELEFAGYFWTFIVMILLAFSGAFVVLGFTSASFVYFANRCFRKNFAPKFRKDLIRCLTTLKFFQTVRVAFWLIISAFFEICAVIFTFNAMGTEISFPSAFVISAILNSLSLVTITPQGIGFVEAGGYFVLSFSIFALSSAQIGSFLILWNIVRIWVPSIAGMILFWCDPK